MEARAEAMDAMIDQPCAITALPWSRPVWHPRKATLPPVLCSSPGASGSGSFAFQRAFQALDSDKSSRHVKNLPKEAVAIPSWIRGQKRKRMIRTRMRLCIGRVPSSANYLGRLENRFHGKGGQRPGNPGNRWRTIW